MSEQALQTVEEKPNGALPVAATPMEMLASGNFFKGSSIETLEKSYGRCKNDGRQTTLAKRLMRPCLTCAPICRKLLKTSDR